MQHENFQELICLRIHFVCLPGASANEKNKFGTVKLNLVINELLYLFL